MNCPHCHANLVRAGRDGDPVIANRGLIIKSDCLIAICPRCKGDVVLNQTLHKAVQQSVVLFFRASDHPSKLPP